MSSSSTAARPRGGHSGTSRCRADGSAASRSIPTSTRTSAGSSPYDRAIVWQVYVATPPLDLGSHLRERIDGDRRVLGSSHSAESVFVVLEADSADEARSP